MTSLFINKLKSIIISRNQIKLFSQCLNANKNKINTNKINLRLIPIKNAIINTQYRYLSEIDNRRLLVCYDDSKDYINNLLKEKQKLDITFTNEEQINEHTVNKHELIMRLNYLTQVDELFNEIQKNINDLKELNEMRSISENQEDEMKKMIEDDYAKLDERLIELKVKMVELLIPEDEVDKESAILELNAGVGGAESRLFCADLYEMYHAFAEQKGWEFKPVKVDSESADEIRKANLEICGTDVYKYFKFESGVHRVQRVPKTETGGRIHTSTCGVVCFPKPAEIKIKLNPKDLKIETKTSGGPGGQHANKTESAVRIEHLPTGIVVYNADERFQVQNRSRALAELEQKLYTMAYEEQLNKKQQHRKMQVGTSGRSERIRTYNYLQDRITDHRINKNFTGITRFLSGDTLNQMIECLRNEHKIEILYEILEEDKQKSSKKNK